MRWMFFFLIIALSSGNSFAQNTHNDLRIVQATGTATLGEDTTRAQAKVLALNYARRNALEQVGVNAKSTSVLFNQELISDLINVSTRGLIVGEKINYVCTVESCTVDLQAQIKLLQESMPHSLTVLHASIQRPGKDAVVNAPILQDKEEIQIKVSLNEDAYLHFFSVDQFGNITKLFPNQYVKPELIPAKKNFVFPDDSQRARGLNLFVTVPINLSRAIESVLIIATKNEINLLEDAAEGSSVITDVMKELSEMDDIPWAEKTIGYEVRK